MKPEGDSIKHMHSADVSQKFSYKILSEKTMLTPLMVLICRKASGPDCVPNSFKDATKSITKPLIMILAPTSASAEEEL